MKTTAKVINGRISFGTLTEEQRDLMLGLPDKKCTKCNDLLIPFWDFPIMVWHKNSLLPIWRGHCFACDKILNEDRRQHKKMCGDLSENYHCPICRKNAKNILEKYPKKLNYKDPFASCWSTDHDHVTREFRGVICQECNRGLGILGDNTETLERACDYLGK